MFARNFNVKFKPIKSNFVVRKSKYIKSLKIQIELYTFIFNSQDLPETYKRLVSTCKTGCLLLHFNDYRSGQYKSVSCDYK